MLFHIFSHLYVMLKCQMFILNVAKVSNNVNLFKSNAFE